MENFDTTCVHPLKEENFNGAVTSGIYPAVAYDYLDHKSLQYPGFYSTYNQQRLGQIERAVHQHTQLAFCGDGGERGQRDQGCGERKMAAVQHVCLSVRRRRAHARPGPHYAPYAGMTQIRCAG